MVQNDNFANRFLLSGVSGSVTGTNAGATAESGEPSVSGMSNTVWYRWVAPNNGTITFDTIGSENLSNVDTYLFIYTGSSIDNLTEVTSHDDIDYGIDLDSRVAVDVAADTEYQIAVDGYLDSEGEFNLNYNFEDAGSPTDISLSTTSITENVKAGTTVGQLTTTDADQMDGFTYELVGGQGSADNSSFEINAGGELNILTSPDFETKSSYSIRVRTTDNDGLSYEETFTIGVEDVREKIEGTSAGERLKGDKGADNIRARAGNDRVYGYDGEDNIRAGRGNDLVYGGNDDDTIRGGRGNDRLRGDAGDDRIFGGRDNDILYGGDGNDFLDGGLGNDRIYGQQGADTIVIGEGTDSIYGFEVGTDKLQLKGYSVEELEITQRGSTSYVKVAETGDTLAKLTRVNAEALAAEGFVTPETMAV